MLNKLKQNLSLILITFATVVLAIIAVVTAVKLQQIGRQPIAPTAPKPAPAREPVSACRLTFTIGGPSVTPTTTPAVTLTPTTTPRVTSTPTPTAPTSTPGPTSTPEPGPTSTPAPPPTPTPTEVQLPRAGISLPTVGAIIGGAVLVITSLLLIL